MVSKEWQNIGLVPDTTINHMAIPRHEMEEMKKEANLERKRDRKRWARRLEEKKQRGYDNSKSFNSMVSKAQLVFNKDIFKATNWLINRLRENSQSWQTKSNTAQLKLATPLLNKTSFDMEAILVKTVFTTMQFYRTLTKKVPCPSTNDAKDSFERRMMSIKEKHHLFPIYVAVPAALSLVIDLIVEELDNPKVSNDAHEQILNCYPRILWQSIITCLDFMKLTLALTLSEDNPISSILQHEDSSSSAKSAAIERLRKVLTNGLVSNPFANPTDIANQMLESTSPDKKPKTSIKENQQTPKPKQKEPAHEPNTKMIPTSPGSKEQVHHCTSCKAFSSKDKSVIKNHQIKCEAKAYTNHFKCKECEKTFAYKTGLAKHHRENRCKPINLTIIQRRDVFKPIHDQTAPKEMKYKCPICHHYSNQDKYYVNRHIDSCFKKINK